jgi:hypothetical protein
MSSLKGSFQGFGGGGAGSFTGSFNLVNQSSTTCSIAGYPQLTLVEASGRDEAIRLHQGGDILHATDAALATIDLAPGASGFFSFEYSAAQSPCVPVSGIDVAVPGSPGHLTILPAGPNGSRFSPCGSPPDIYISPVRSGTGG